MSCYGDVQTKYNTIPFHYPILALVNILLSTICIRFIAGMIKPSFSIVFYWYNTSPYKLVLVESDTSSKNMSAKNKLVQHTFNCVQNHITTTYGSLKYTQVFMLCDFITQKAKSWLITFHKSFKSKLHKNLIKHCQFSIWFWKVLISPLWNLRRKWIFARKRRIHITNKRFQQFPAFKSVQGVLIENYQK